MAVPFVPAAALFLMMASAPVSDAAWPPQARADAAVVATGSGPVAWLTAPGSSTVASRPAPEAAGESSAGVLNRSLLTLLDEAGAMPTEAGRPGALIRIETPANAAGERVVGLPPERPVPLEPGQESFHFWPAFGQTMIFIGLQNVARLTRPQVWDATVEGPFFDDWFKSAAGLFDNNWNDGNKWITNYLAHPLGGAVYGFIYRGNSKYRNLMPGDEGYVTGFFKAMAWSAVASLNHEIGPLSEASFGNIGLDNPDQQAWVDPVITPTLGAVWMVFEDVIKQKVLSKIQGRTTHAILHCFLNPSRTTANAFMGRLPWKR